MIEPVDLTTILSFFPAAWAMQASQAVNNTAINLGSLFQNDFGARI